MSEDYGKGFKDGFAAGLEEGKKIKERSYMDGYNDGLIEGMKKTLPPPYNPNPQWPSWPYITSDVSNVVRGAVGSEVSYTVGAEGANGPPGPQGKMPSYEEEKERLAHYNQVWINGQWAELGG